MVTRFFSANPSLFDKNDFILNDKNKYNHESSFKIGFSFLNLFYCFVWNDNSEFKSKKISSLDFKKNARSSDMVFLMTAMESYSYMPMNWREAILVLNPCKTLEEIVELQFSNLYILDILLIFTERLSILDNEDYSDFMFFMQSMLFREDRNQIGWDFLEQLLKDYDENPKNKYFTQILYHCDFPEKDPFYTDCLCINEFGIEKLEENLAKYQIKPTFGPYIKHTDPLSKKTVILPWK